MPTSARLFVYEDLRETMTTPKKGAKFTWFPSAVCERKTSAAVFISCYYLYFEKIKNHFLSKNNFIFFFYIIIFKSVYLVLGSIHRFRSSSSLRPHPQIEDDDRRGDVHSKFGATQFGCQSAHLLPIFYTSLSQSQVNTLLWCQVEMNNKNIFRHTHTQEMMM